MRGLDIGRIVRVIQSDEFLPVGTIGRVVASPPGEFCIEIQVARGSITLDKLPFTGHAITGGKVRTRGWYIRRKIVQPLRDLVHTSKEFDARYAQ